MGSGGAKYREIRGGREATAPPERWGIQNPKRIKIDGSALAAEICAGPHNRLLRRQHCSSLCSQSEGHEHVANMTSALGHNFVGFLVLVRHNIRPPHFASKVSYSASPHTSAKCPRGAPCSDAASPLFPWLRFFFRFNRLPSPFFSFHDSSPLCVPLFPVFPHPPVPSYYNRVFLLFL